MRRTIRLTLILLLITVFCAVIFIERSRKKNTVSQQETKPVLETEVTTGPQFSMLSSVQSYNPRPTIPNMITSDPTHITDQNQVGRESGKVEGDKSQTLANSHSQKPLDLKTQDKIGNEGQGPENSARCYKVEQNDNLWKISLKVYKTPKYIKLIKDANPSLLEKSSALQIGMVLKIPPIPKDNEKEKLTKGKDGEKMGLEQPTETSNSSSYHIAHKRGAKSTKKGAYKEDGVVAKDANKSSPINIKDGKVLYKVNKGESLISIARRVLGNGSRWLEIYDTNKQVLQEDPNNLRAGMTLVIYRSGSHLYE